MRLLSDAGGRVNEAGVVAAMKIQPSRYTGTGKLVIDYL